MSTVTQLDTLKFSIAVTNLSGRETKNWKNEEWTWQKLIDKLSVPQVTHETCAMYDKASKAEQDNLKDVGGFVGGYLNGGRRKKGSVLHRQLVCLDEDQGAPDTWEDLTMLEEFTVCMYTTHKHRKDAPRRRFVIPLDREVNAAEYQAIARRIAADIGINQFDHTTFQPERLMYWPSISKDAIEKGAWAFAEQRGPLLSADAILARYRDWQDVSEWPMSERESQEPQRQMKAQGDPLEKPGVIGAFCRAYTIHEAIEKFLSDVYDPTDMEDRYTYKHGSTAGGLIVYDDKFAYSHHATDIAGQKLCNAFDLVRHHMFGTKDDASVKPGTPVAKLPSYIAMMDFARGNEKVCHLSALEQLQSAFDDFGAVDVDTNEEIEITEENTQWMKKLARNKKDEAEATIDNIMIILKNDPRLKGRFGFNLLAQREGVLGKLPWAQKEKDIEYFTDADESGLAHYLERCYLISNGQKIQHAMKNIFTENAFNPLHDYLESLNWDGVPRIDTLLIDFLGAADEFVTRAVTRKTLVGAVRRVYQPGSRVDNMLTLVGRQGAGKSTFVQKLAVRSDWYTESVKMDGKEKVAEESVNGVWIAEVGELAAMSKAQVDTIKSFLSKGKDRYRAAFGKRVEDFPRQCIFIGTTNNRDFLKDPTGNRRFWIVDTGVQAPTLSVWVDLEPIVGQVWAEAVHFFKKGETVHLTPELQALAEAVQAEFTEVDERVGKIEMFLEQKLPADWADLDLYTRRSFLVGVNDPDALQPAGTVRRDVVCVAEIFCEAFAMKPDAMTKYNTRDFHIIMQNMPGWERGKAKRQFGPIYGKQTAYVRKNGTESVEKESSE